MANAPAPKGPAPKGPAPKGPAPKKEKNLSPPEEDDDDDLKKPAEKNDQPAPKGGLPLKLIVMVVAAMAAGGGGALGAMKFFGGSPTAPAFESLAEDPDGEGGHAAPPVAPQRASGGNVVAAETGGHGAGAGRGESDAWSDWGGPVNVEFKPFIVNLNDMGGRRMLKLTMSIEAEHPDLAEELNAKMPQVRDTVLLLLSSIQSDDSSGLDGKQRLKNQMLNRINPLLTKGKVRNLYLSEIVVQ
jgi:flagellar FliL protein